MEQWKTYFSYDNFTNNGQTIVFLGYKNKGSRDATSNYNWRRLPALVHAAPSTEHKERVWQAKTASYMKNYSDEEIFKKREKK